MNVRKCCVFNGLDAVSAQKSPSENGLKCGRTQTRTADLVLIRDSHNGFVQFDPVLFCFDVR